VRGSLQRRTGSLSVSQWVGKNIDDPYTYHISDIHNVDLYTMRDSHSIYLRIL
jgi:hypothetical protein